MFGLFTQEKTEEDTFPTPPLVFTNTLSGKKEVLEVPSTRPARMYNCGPTVYDRQHIGNLAMYVFVDVLRRTLAYNHISVRQVINITDVGHLSGDNEGDADVGEDKMTKGLKREGKELTIENMRELAERYTSLFLDDLAALNIATAETEFPRASDYIEAQIAMIQTLEDKGYAYKISDGIYFDTAVFPTYGQLGNIKIETLQEGARVAANPEKRNSADFALWKFNDALGWDSPWGKGFPGWHIECSAMARDLLGEQIDIHTGGIEHIPIHHNNEIAQSESATGKKPFSRIWLHRAHIQINGEKIAKSQGGAIYLSDIIEKGFHPLSYRYWLLNSHYRTPANFTWEGLEGAQQALIRLHSRVSVSKNTGGAVIAAYEGRFHERINDDLDTPGALAVVWDLLKDTSHSADDVYATLLVLDTVLGLQLGEPDKQLQTLLSSNFGTVVDPEQIPGQIQTMLTDRETARSEKNWEEADRLRKSIEEHGYIIEDAPDGPRLLQK